MVHYLFWSFLVAWILSSQNFGEKTFKCWKQQLPVTHNLFNLGYLICSWNKLQGYLQIGMIVLKTESVISLQISLRYRLSGAFTKLPSDMDTELWLGTPSNGVLCLWCPAYYANPYPAIWWFRHLRFWFHLTLTP